jgi:1-acyl-sn-glycerol-3-phosphate acyltransferase
MDTIYRAMRGLIGLALGFYFRRIERFHPERVPARGPVLFVSNHPNSLTDSFIIGSSVPRKLNFVATVQLFRIAPLKWLLTRCGVIPINRVKDDPKAMRTVASTFEACYRVLEGGEAVGIFPEGITYDDSQLKEVKSGAARMALELEQRHDGKLGLQIVPAGLTYSAKEVYRSDVLVHFGEPIQAAEFLKDYAEHRKECINKLTAEIERRLQSLILHLPHLEHARVIAAVQRLYLDKLRIGNSVIQEPTLPGAEALLLSRRITEVVEQVFEREPERAAKFAEKLANYERWLARLRLPEEEMARSPGRRRTLLASLGWSWLAVVGAPIALYGWIHRLIPYLVVSWAIRKFPEPTKRKAQLSTTVIAAGIVAFGLCFCGYVALVQYFFGWPSSLWYGLSLPVASLFAHYYLRDLKLLGMSLRHLLILWRAPMAEKRLLAMRADLIARIEAVHAGLVEHQSHSTETR